jgi:hemolysin III
MGDQMRRGAERMGERVDAAREAMGDRATAAREAVGERADAAREATADAIAAVKPRLRGVSHEWAFFVSLFLGAGLIVAAKTPRATFAVAIYAVSLSALFGTSALYHRVNWRRPSSRRWMRRLDHSMIFLLIAGTYTAFALLALHGTLATAILVAVWAGALAGSIVEMIWIEAPKWVTAIIYLSLGWVAIVAFPALWRDLGVAGTLLVAAGGLLYTLGAIVYATQRPDPNPAVFGYHEVFHLLVIAAAAAQFGAVAFFALPAG